MINKTSISLHSAGFISRGLFQFFEPSGELFGKGFPVPIEDHDTGKVEQVAVFVDDAFGGGAGGPKPGFTEGALSLDRVDMWTAIGIGKVCDWSVQ